MDRSRKQITYHKRGAALLIVLAFVVLLTGVSVAYLSRTTSDRQVAHGSFNQSKSDQLVASAMDNNIADDGTDPIAAFTAPDWVFVTSDITNQTAGRKVITAPDQTVIGRYAYAIYDEGALLDVNVAGYPTDPSTAPVPAQRVGRKGS